jgi:4-amino-4-deoxy-L-arabinose transferase-like glycosyltransferase
LGENAGKFAARSSNYFSDLLRGGDSIWMLALTTIANAGLFTFVLISALIRSWRERRLLSFEEVLLLLWVFAFFVVFSLPSQRSGRYLLPVMPALAALIAVYWDRLPFWGFRIALILQLLILGALAYLGANLQLSTFLGAPGIWAYSYWHWLLIGISLLLVMLGLVNRERCKFLALAGTFLCYCALTSSLAPLEGALGRYTPSVIEQVSSQDVWIPCDYRAKDEEYRLLLPGAKLHGYLAKDANNIGMLSDTYSIVAVQSPIGVEPAICDSCKIIGKRMEMRARHSEAEIHAMLKGQIGEYLFVNEYLIATPSKHEPDLSVKDACR